jgi:hypothetical protein
VKAVQSAATLFLVIGLAACAPTSTPGAVTFGTSNGTQFVKAGKYAVTVEDDCGTTVKTVVGQISGGAWSDPLLNGTPLAIPRSGNYTVTDPVGYDLMQNISPCSLEFTVALTPLKH